VFFFEQCSIIAEKVVCYGWFLDTELASEVWLNQGLFIVFVEEDVKLEPTIPTLTPSALTHSVRSFCFLAHQTFVFRSLVDSCCILSIVFLCALKSLKCCVLIKFLKVCGRRSSTNQK